MEALKKKKHYKYGHAVCVIVQIIWSMYKKYIIIIHMDYTPCIYIYIYKCLYFWLIFIVWFA